MTCKAQGGSYEFRVASLKLQVLSKGITKIFTLALEFTIDIQLNFISASGAGIFRIMSAAFSAMATTLALVLAPGTRG